MSASNPSAFFNYVNDKFISINNNQDRLKQKYKNNDDSANILKQSLYSDDNILGINDLDNYVKKNNIVFKLDPLNAKLYRLAAQISSNNGNTNKANEMMVAASILSIHEVTANRYMFLINFYNNKLDTALYYADRLFSAAPEFIENYKTQMARYVQDDISRSILIKYLTHKPLWRYHFFQELYRKAHRIRI